MDGCSSIKRRRFGMKRKLKYWGILLCVLGILAGCGQAAEKESAKAPAPEVAEERVITDMAGREVQIKGDIQSAVAIGPGCLRLYSYAGDMSKIIGVEQLEKDKPYGRPYILAYPELAEKDIIGPGGPNNAPDAEKILASAPDVIFTTYNSETSAVEELQAKTGIPVVVLSYGKSAAFDPNMYDSLKCVGKVMGSNEKAEAAVAYMEACAKDLKERTSKIDADKRPKVYAGALSMRGSHGIESTQGGYALFKVTNVLNVADETDKKGPIMVDKEKLIEWDPEIIFVDYGGLEDVKKDMEANPKYYESLSAFVKGATYPLLPYNFYSTNIDTAMIDAYYIGQIVYPEQFKDINIEEKAAEIYTKLLGKNVYDKMKADFGPFEPLAFK